ncbi:MAG: hypothetical protein ACLPSH_09800 [Vulcanimicrobiaceae bacterium]|jgi:hypothetical protein
MANELAATLKRELREARRRLVHAPSEDDRSSLGLFCTYLETQLARYEVHDPPQPLRSTRERELEVPA